MAGWAAGTYNNIVLVGWSANLGTTWAEVSAELIATYFGASFPANAFFGESMIGYLTPNEASPGAAIFGSAADANGLPIYNPATDPMVLYPSPEPSTLALAGLGGLSLWLFRRRK